MLDNLNNSCIMDSDISETPTTIEDYMKAFFEDLPVEFIVLLAALAAFVIYVY